VRTPIVCVLLFAAATGARAPLTAQEAPNAMCFRGRPADRCRWFSITETRFHFPLVGGAGAYYLIIEGGLMRNVSRTAAVGITGWGGVDVGESESVGRYGFALRGRHWTGPQTSVEGSIGAGRGTASVSMHCTYTVQGDYSCVPHKEGFGTSVALQLNRADRYHFALRLERMPGGRSCPRQYAALDGCLEMVPQPGGFGARIGVDRSVPAQTWHVYAGAGVGSKMGVGTWIIGAALMGLFAAAWQQ